MQRWVTARLWCKTAPDWSGFCFPLARIRDYHLLCLIILERTSEWCCADTNWEEGCHIPGMKCWFHVTVCCFIQWMCIVLCFLCMFCILLDAFLVLSFSLPFNTFCTTEQGPCSSRLCSRCLRNEAFVPWTLLLLCWKTHQTETGLKTNCLPMKGENSITSHCIVFTFKWAKMWWLFKKSLVSEAFGTYISWIMVANIKLMTWTMDGCLILNKMRRRVK